MDMRKQHVEIYLVSLIFVQGCVYNYRVSSNLNKKNSLTFQVFQDVKLNTL